MENSILPVQNGALPVDFTYPGLRLNTPALLPDELFFSYLSRVAKANATTLRVMLFQLGVSYSKFDRPKLSLGNHATKLDALFSVKNTDSIYAQTSIEAIRAISSKTSFEGKSVAEIAEHTVNRPDIITFRFCPDCFKTDIEKFGTAYIHRSHCVPYVCRCHIHGSRLSEYQKAETEPEVAGENCCGQKFNYVLENAENCEWEEHEANDLPFGMEYAVFVHNLIASGRVITMAAIKRTLRACSYLGYCYDEAAGGPSETEEIAYGEKPLTCRNFIRNQRTAGGSPGFVAFIATVFFGDFTTFTEAIEKYANSKKPLTLEETVAIGNEFQLIECSSNNNYRVATIRHNKCGGTFFRGVSEFMTRGRRCPICEKKQFTAQGFCESFNAEFSGCFELLDEYTDSAAMIRARIKDTEIIIKDRPYVLNERLRLLKNDPAELKRVIETGVVRDLVTAKARMLSYIENHYADDEPFLAASLPLSLDMNLILDGLKRSRKIHMVAKGIYCRTKIEMSDEDVLSLRYLKNKEGRIGVIIGESLEKMAAGEPLGKTIYLSTVKRTTTIHPDEAQIGNTRCIVFPIKTMPTEQMWKSIALLETIRHEKSFSSNPDLPLLAKWAVENNVNTFDVMKAGMEYAPSMKGRAMELIKEMRKCQGQE